MSELELRLKSMLLRLQWYVGAAYDYELNLTFVHTEKQVHVDNAEHVTIEGGGTIYGNAEHAWSYFSAKDDRFSPYGDDGSKGRPNVLLITKSRDIVLRDLHLHNSTDWTLRMEQSRDIFADNLDIYGDGEQREKLSELVKKLNANVKFMGKIDNALVPDTLRKYDYFILPSFYEGMPKSLIEAMACGILSIGTPVNGIIELIDDEKTGVLTEDTSSESIKIAIRRAMNFSSNEKLKIQQNSLKIIQKNFGLVPIKYKTNGPSRYFKTNKSKSVVGFISPISNHFCETCNRIRITSAGILYGCLGHDSQVDLKPFLNKKNSDSLTNIIKETIFNKPEKHYFSIDSKSLAEGSNRDNIENLTGGGRTDDLFGSSDDLSRSRNRKTCP